jgi:hypothetical protein
MFFDGFSVSPAVIPKLSVPPSIKAKRRYLILCKAEDLAEIPTRETGSNKHISESTESTNEWCARYMPIMATNIMVLVVDADIHENPDDDKDDDRSNFQRGKPVLCDGNN